MHNKADGELLEKPSAQSHNSSEVEAKLPEQVPKKPRKPRKEKLHIAMPQQLKERLDELVELTDASGPSDVIRAALVLYDLAYQEHARGSDLLIRSESGDVARLRIFL